MILIKLPAAHFTCWAAVICFFLSSARDDCCTAEVNSIKCVTVIMSSADSAVHESKSSALMIQIVQSESAKQHRWQTWVTRGRYKWKLPAENLYPGFVQPLSFMSSQRIREEKNLAASIESNHASAVVFPVSHHFVWADCVFCGKTSWWEWTLVNSSSHGCADCSTH